MALAYVSPGQRATVVGIHTDEKVKRRLESLGITVGEQVLSVADRAGDVILDVKGYRLALGKDLAMKITVAVHNG